jgi:hypothetical protein
MNRIKTSLHLALTTTVLTGMLVLHGCTEPDDPELELRDGTVQSGDDGTVQSGDDGTAQSGDDDLVYIDRATAEQILASNGGVASTPTGEMIEMGPEDLCEGPNAHIEIPEGYRAVPNETQDGFLLVSDDADPDASVTASMITCSGCPTGCAPYTSGKMSGCTNGCKVCSMLSSVVEIDSSWDQ